jgi:transcriptional regulator with XRE-family HTH domain
MIAYGYMLSVCSVGKSRNDEYIIAFGLHVKKLRESKKLSREKLSALSDIETMQIYRIETGRINTTISTLQAVAKALNVPPKKLLDFEY